MPSVGRPKVDRTLPKALTIETVSTVLAALDKDDVGRNSWPERDRAIVLTVLLTGLRSEELIQLNVGQVRIVDDGSAVLHVRGKGNKDRHVPVESGLVVILERYLGSRSERHARLSTSRRRPGAKLSSWEPTSPLFVGTTGDRITRGTLQYRVRRLYRRAGVDGQREKGALVHGLRHTYATALANQKVSVYTLMKLLGHESMATAQRYVSGAGVETRPAAALNPIYRLVVAESDAVDQRGDPPSS
ncbi:tyrosine-type recombinase/integrase [Antrihabitans spumae]|uniref:Tyrosine-type recombinase/integrase n=1 Tax=Antrihabitans spumae TaxID=3373370 RepID=A0ABW7KTQ9_9NOCA